MDRNAPLGNASILRQRAARVRYLAENVSDQRYIALFLAAASAYENGALELEAEQYRSSLAYASAAE